MLVRKKICLLDYDMSVTGGVEQVTANLANAFCDFYEVVVISVRMGKPEPAYLLKDKITFENLMADSTRLRYLPRKVAEKLTAILQREQIDVVLLMGNYAAFSTFRVQKRVDAKFIFCDHGALINQWSDKTITLIRFLMARRSHQVVTLTNQNKLDYRSKFHIKKDKIRYIYNWIELTNKEKVGDYNIESKKIISVGRITYEKGYNLLIEVAESVFNEVKDWTWDIYGEGEDFDKIHELIKVADLEDRIHLMGNVKEVRSLLQGYSFLVLPSYREGLPLVLLEAKEHRLPIVSFDIKTGPSEMVQHGVNGCLVKPYDTQKMADCILTLINNKNKRKEYSEHAYLDLDKFDKSIILKEWKELIDGL